MRRFRFTLQAVLTLRQRREHEALEKYAGALRARESAAERLERLRRDQEEAWEGWRCGVKSGCTAGNLGQWREYDRGVTEQRERAQQALRQAELAVERALQEVLGARQDRQVVDKHLEKEKARYNLEAGRSEQKHLDELANRRPNAVLSWSARARQPVT